MPHLILVDGTRIDVPRETAQRLADIVAKDKVLPSDIRVVTSAGREVVVMGDAVIAIVVGTVSE